jgi:probable HAF family extracellular repeat protein
MRIRRRAALQLLAVLSLQCLCTAAGVTYPDGTVSPFPPAFIPIGILGGASETTVFGVAAQDGVIFGAVGYSSVSGTVSGEAPLLYTPRDGTISLPRQALNVDGRAFGISADGKFKVGTAGNHGCYWNGQNELQILPGTGSSSAFTISADGSTIGGAASEEGPSGPVNTATLWATGGTGRSLIGTLPQFDASIVRALSLDGQTVCGSADRFERPDKSISGATRAFYRPKNGVMTELPALDQSLNPNDQTFANDLNASGKTIVGTSDRRGVLWDVFDPGVRVIYTFQTGDYASAAFGIDGKGTYAVGHVYTVDNEFNAVMWDTRDVRPGSILALRGTIKGLLANPYRINIGNWKLTSAYCISKDGFTVGGNGINPEGNTEGWLAVLPPVLHPPAIDSIPPQSVEPGQQYKFPVHVTSVDEAPAFAAKNLPAGFTIDSASGIITGAWDGVHPPSATYTVIVTVKDSQGSSSRSFQLSLQQDPVDQVIDGLGYLPNNKPPGENAVFASFGGGISANGAIAVGHDGIANDSRAFRWTREGMAGLPLLPGALRAYGLALATSADGQTIVGQAAAPPADDGSNRSVAVVWKNTAGISGSKQLRDRSASHYALTKATAELSAINLGLFPGGIISIAQGVSSDGAVVAGYGDAKDPDPNYRFQVYQAFRWTAANGMVGLGWLPGGLKFSQAYGISGDGSTIVGVSDSSIGTQAMRWTAAQGMTGLGKPAGASYGRAVAASTDGSVIVGYNTVGDNNRAFRWTAIAGMTDLGVVSGDSFSEATAIAADGSVVVGRSGAGFSQTRPFIWDKTNGMRDLKSVLVAGNPNLAAWTLKSADGISADGKTVTGTGNNPNGDLEAYAAVLDVQPAQPLNISTRMRVLTGDKVLIGGFIITGNEAKKVIIRGIGPSLAGAGLQGVMADPTLELHQGSSTLVTNDNWKEHEAEVRATTLPPSNDLESAIVVTLSPGSYTAILADKLNQPGLGLVEIYDLAPGANSKLANISTRGFVDLNDNVMIGGFIVGGGSIGGAARIIVRAIGPSLAASGVSGGLQDTTLELYDGNGNSVATNDNWKVRPDGTSQRAEIEATTIPPKDDRESAIVSTLGPGNYTAIVRGSGNRTGVALVEAYNL